jgi:hypothetical protein
MKSVKSHTEGKMSQRLIVGILLVLIAALTACGSSEADTPAEESELAPTGFEDFANRALPETSQLQIGTLMLEETPNAVTPAQAQELLPLWQMLRALQQSDTTSQVEIEATVDQIQAIMTPEQTAAIKEMNLTMADMRDLMQELGIIDEDEFARQREQGDDEESLGGMGPPSGMPGEGGVWPPGGEMPGQGGMGPQGNMPNLSPEEQATRQAERMNSGFFGGTALLDALIELLEARAAEL